LIIHQHLNKLKIWITGFFQNKTNSMWSNWIQDVNKTERPWLEKINSSPNSLTQSYLDCFILFSLPPCFVPWKLTYMNYISGLLQSEFNQSETLAGNKRILVTCFPSLPGHGPAVSSTKGHRSRWLSPAESTISGF
jgi:hypothetical protein